MTKFTAEFLESQNKAELRKLCCLNHIGYNGLNNEGMRAALLTVPGDDDAPGGPQDEQTVEAMHNPVTATEQVAEVQPVTTTEPTPVVLPPVLAPVVQVPAVSRKIQSNRPEQHGVKRPSEGTICAQIWAWCDEVHKGGDVVKAKELRAALPGLDDTTKTVQFYRWRKFNGIQGRN